MSTPAPRLLGGSLLVAVAAAAATWLAAAGTLPYGVPPDAVAVFSTAVGIAVAGFGTLLLVRRTPAVDGPARAAALTGPVLLGVLMAVGTTAAWWFAAVSMAGYVGAGLLGLRAGGSGATTPPARHADQRGAGSLELVGIVIVAAILVTVLTATVAARDPQVRETIWAQICKITGGSCPPGEAPTQQAYKPANCETYSSERSVRGVVDVAFVRLGGGGAVQRTELSDGTIDITLLGEGRGGLVASAGGRAEFEFGSSSLKAQLEAEAAITGGYANGDTYTFTDRDQADAFQGYLERELAEDVAAGTNPVLGLTNSLVEWATGEEPPTNSGVQKTYVRYDLTEEASASASAGFGSGAEVSGSYMVAKGSEYDRGQDPDDSSDDLQTDFYQVDWSAAAQAGLPPVYTVGGSHEASGIVKVVRDVDGEPLRVEIIDRSTGSLEVGGVLSDGSFSPLGEPGQKPSTLESFGIDIDGSSTNSVVVNQRLDLDTPEKRAAFDAWFNWSNGLDTALESTVPGVDSPGGDNVVRGEDFAALIGQEGKVSVIEYDGDTFGLGAALELGLGLKLGVDVGTEEKSSEAVKASYLGAPASDGTRPVYDLPECS